MGWLVSALVGVAAMAAMAAVTASCSAPGPPVATSHRSSAAWVEPSASVPELAPGPRHVQLQVGHCYVEPVDFAGRRWGLRFSDQFGWGGPQYYPRNWTGAGVLTQVTPDRVRYTDDGGAQLTLLPASSPAVARANAVPCR
jgi:hypothetical protein